MIFKKRIAFWMCAMVILSICSNGLTYAADKRIRLSVEKIIAAYDRSVVVIEGYDGQNEALGFGSGFYVGNGMFLTNYHVMNQAGAKAFKLYTSNNRTYDVEGVVKYDKTRDLALIKAKRVLALPIVKTCNYSKIQKGERIIAIGNPEGLQNSVSEGIVSSKRTITENNLKTNLVQITASITFGSSGGPVFNMYGEVIGLSTFGLEGQGNLNFAVAVDYALPWLSALKNKSFAAIKTINLATSLASTSNQNSSSTAKPGVSVVEAKPVNFLNGFELPAGASDVVMHPTKSCLYLSNTEMKTVYMVDYLTRKTTTLAFADKPESLWLEGDKLYVGLVKKGHAYYDATADFGSVAIVDASSLKLLEQFDVDIDPFDILVGKDGYLYITSGSNQWTSMKSYDLISKQRNASAFIRMQSYAELNTSLDRIYTMDTDTSPRDFKAFNIENGTFKTPSYGSPYHGDYKLDKSFRISPDGKFLFNSAGTIFTCAKEKADDMKYFASLNTDYIDIAFDVAGDSFFVIMKNGMIYSYTYSNLGKLKTYSMHGEPVKLFYKAGSLIAVTKIGGKFGIEKLSVK